MKKISAIIAATLITFTMIAPTAYADEWVKTDSGYVYEYNDGTTAKKGWLTIGKDKYYIQKDGTRKTGWLKTSLGTKYYFGKDGKMYKSRWLTFKDGTKYYLRANGKAATGLLTIGKVQYKFDKNGKCLGENHFFILNTDSLCLHSSETCRAAKKIDKENYDTINIGENEFKKYSNNNYWCCGVEGCNPDYLENIMPKPKK